MIDPNDDLGLAKKPLKVIACIPVKGRLPLLKHTIERLLKKNGVYKVICTGFDNSERDVCEKAGAIFLKHSNRPLGQKWNFAFQEASKYHPDACIFVGSSDFISDNWIQTLSPHIHTHDLVGLPGCYFADIQDNGQVRVCYWPGYKGRREGESIGIGRLISARCLEKIKWQPFDKNIDNSLDFSMYQKIMNEKRYLLKTYKCQSLSISTNVWSNKHRFDEHWLGLLPSTKLDNPKEFLQNNFPEALKIFE